MANRFWVGGSGNWNDPNHWAASFGTAGLEEWGGASVPGPDEVAFICGTFLQNQTIIADVDINVKGIVCNGSYYRSGETCYPISLDFNGKNIKTSGGYPYGLSIIWGKVDPLILSNSNIETSILSLMSDITVVSDNSKVTIIPELYAPSGEVLGNFSISGHHISELIIDLNGTTDPHIAFSFTELYIDKWTLLPQADTNVYFAFQNLNPSGFIQTENFDVNGSIIDNMHVYFAIFDIEPKNPWILKQKTGSVNLENCSLTGCYATGGAIFNAFISKNNIDGGGNLGWNFGDFSVNIKQSTADPVTIDTGNVIIQGMGNLAVQGRIVSKTIQMALFTNNRNAVWAGKQNLRKESYPLASINFPASRKAFRYEVGDCFKFSYAKYGVVNMICRVLQIQEDGPESENINITAMEDIFAVNAAITEYADPVKHTIPPATYPVFPFENQKIYEAPYVLTPDGSTQLLALACRKYPSDLGFGIYMSVDDGVAYQLVGRSVALVPFGKLIAPYPANTFSIDDAGFIIDFEQDAEQIETATWGEVFAGMRNLALLGDEIISFQGITPVTATQYQLTGILRGRFGTQKQDHLTGEGFYFITANMALIAHSEISKGAARFFKFVPYNIKSSGSLAIAEALDISIIGKAATPYIPINFTANGGAFAARYDDDVVLAWSPRYRGRGAGIGLPGIALPDAAREGLFKIEVWVDDVLMRTVDAVDAVTWTYTEAMNIEDNSALVASVTFKLSNYLTIGSVVYESEQVEVICKKN